MAQEIRSFQCLIPKNTPITAPVSIDMSFPTRVVREIDIRVPPGPLGSMGFAIGAAGVRVIPYNANAFIVTDDERMSWPIEGMQDSGSWTLFGYNTGQYDHTVYVRFLLDLVAEPAPTAPTPVANLVGLSSDLVVPADLSTLAVT